MQPDKRSGLQMIPISLRILWSEANARCNSAFLDNVPWVARHLDSKLQEEDVWEDCHDATLIARGVVYGDIVHSMRCFNNVAHLCAPTGAHFTTATDMLWAQVQKVVQEELLTVQEANSDRCLAWCAVGSVRCQWPEVCNIPPLSWH